MIPYIAPALLALFLTAGRYKSVLPIPVDTTALFAGLVAAAIAYRFLVTLRIPWTLGWMTVLFAAFLPGVFISAWEPYGTQKMLHLFTLTLLASVAPLYLMREARQIRTFFWTVTAVGVGLALTSVGGFMQQDLPGRWSAFGGNPIPFSRTASMGLVWVAVLAVHRKLSLVLAGPISALMVVVMIGSGSRGPLLAAAIGLFIAFGLGVRAGALSFSRYVIILVFVLMGGLGLLTVAPEAVPQRLSLNPSVSDQSTSPRWDAYRRSVAIVYANPVGVGWGGYRRASSGSEFDYIARQIAQSPSLSSEVERVYPHNMLLETAVEGGWIAAVAVAAVFTGAVVSLARRAWTVEAQALVVLLITSIINAAVSGDVNDNRMVFALCAASLVYARALKVGTSGSGTPSG